MPYLLNSKGPPWVAITILKKQFISKMKVKGDLFPPGFLPLPQLIPKYAYHFQAKHLPLKLKREIVSYFQMVKGIRQSGFSPFWSTFHLFGLFINHESFWQMEEWSEQWTITNLKKVIQMEIPAWGSNSLDQK